MPSVKLDEEKFIFYEDIGEGIPVIFVHPPGMGRHVFYFQRKLKQHMRLLMPDLSGHGDSSRVNAEKISIEYYAKELVMFMDKLNIDQAVFCGYSAGGAITQYISVFYQERVRGLILFGGYPTVQHTLFKWEHKAGMYLVEKQKALLAYLLSISHTNNEKFQKILYKHMIKSQGEVWKAYYQEVLHYNVIRYLDKINVPVLIMYGTKSDLINKYTNYYKQRIKEIRIVYFKRTNHQVPTKRSKLANLEIERFIKYKIDHK
ncbi:alpha/beta fold hydrolase [Bacillus weihaiensis]|uniref:AB hydrolase-1 domain-containing protein n=1 Tax=Bacillus weihaiensis TaxID=1547283 RepID=A0A1L3MQZ9_9BACI|nr:alpha/beta hydrolase [Bacillus weihaiensis]APH04769.1 hypothetical protein A9C19_08430 [Bacillus weihaiensis]